MNYFLVSTRCAKQVDDSLRRRWSDRSLLDRREAKTSCCCGLPRRWPSQVGLPPRPALGSPAHERLQCVGRIVRLRVVVTVTVLVRMVKAIRIRGEDWGV